MPRRISLTLLALLPACGSLASGRKAANELRLTLSTIRKIAERAEEKASSLLPLILAGGALASTWGKTLYRKTRT